MLSKIISQRTTTDRFSFTCSQEQAEQLLTACYNAEVQARGREFIRDGSTQDNIRRLATWLTDTRDPRFGVMFCGGVGNGKTTMLKALADAIDFMTTDEGHDFKKLHHTLYIIDAAKADISKADYGMLGIDDLGTEPVEVRDYGNITTPIIDLLTARYQRCLFTAITTNLIPKDIRERYGARIADRFNEMFIPIGFSQGTYRSPVDINHKLKNK